METTIKEIKRKNLGAYCPHCLQVYNFRKTLRFIIFLWFFLFFMLLFWVFVHGELVGIIVATALTVFLVFISMRIRIVTKSKIRKSKCGSCGSTIQFELIKDSNNNKKWIITLLEGPSNIVGEEKSQTASDLDVQEGVQKIRIEDILLKYPPLNKFNKAFDAESFQLIESMHKQRKIIGTISWYLNLFAMATHGAGVIMFIITVRDFSWVSLLSSLSIVGLGVLLGYLNKKYFIDKIPVGNIILELIKALQNGKMKKAVKFSSDIINKTGIKNNNLNPLLLARAISFQIVDVYSENDDQTTKNAEKASMVYGKFMDSGLKTPLVYFGLALSFQIAKKKDDSIDYYSRYLKLRPNDNFTKNIVKQIKEE